MTAVHAPVGRGGGPVHPGVSRTAVRCSQPHRGPESAAESRRPRVGGGRRSNRDKFGERGARTPCNADVVGQGRQRVPVGHVEPRHLRRSAIRSFGWLRCGAARFRPRPGRPCRGGGVPVGHVVVGQHPPAAQRLAELAPCQQRGPVLVCEGGAGERHSFTGEQGPRCLGVGCAAPPSAWFPSGG